MRREYIAWFDMPNSGKLHGQSVMPGQELIRCKDCRYYDARAKTMDALCTRKQGCRETIPEGFCGWAIPKMYEVEHETDRR